MMKKLILLVCVLAVGLVQAQDKKPNYEVAGEMVKATYYYEDGSVFREGYFKNAKLEGQWIQYDKSGNKVAIGNYKQGKKVGKWFLFNKNTLREVNYQNNVIASVKSWKEDTQVAVK